MKKRTVYLVSHIELGESAFPLATFSKVSSAKFFVEKQYKKKQKCGRRMIPRYTKGDIEISTLPFYE
jgi:hypothetical protein